jgi:hypothetical protein
MISANDVLQAISEIHQYSMLLIELKNSTTVVILHSAHGAMNYFKFEGSLTPSERSGLAAKIRENDQHQGMTALTIEELIGAVDGQRAKHIWLEAIGHERKEHGFVSIAELKTFLRTNPHR